MQEKEAPSELEKAREQHAFSTGVLAYIYGFPLVRLEQIRRQFLSQSGELNQLRHRRRLQTHLDRGVVSPNNDTVYSSAWLDLAAEPLMLHVPDAKARYCSYAFYDAYTNNFKVISQRADRDEEADYAVVGPQWKGALPKGVQRIDAPTNKLWLLVRTLIADEADWPGVQALQERMRLAPLSQWGRKTSALTTSNGAVAANTLQPQPSAIERGPLQFFALLGALLQENPPPQSEATLLAQFERIGITLRKGFDPQTLDAATVAGLTRAIPVAKQIIVAESSGEALGSASQGWVMVSKGGVFGDDYLFRAVIAERGIGQLIPAEATYFMADHDGAGRPLNGAHKYTLRFAKGALPPVRAFWSLTMYGADHFFIENPINRYAIGDRTRGLQYDAAGSLTIYLQHEAPPGKESNWLPAPLGNFRLSLRAYLPKSEMLNGDYRPPPVMLTQ